MGILRTLTKNTTTSWSTTRASLSSTSGEVKIGRITRQHCCCSEKNCHLSEKKDICQKGNNTASSLWPAWTTDKTQWQANCLFGISKALLTTTTTTTTMKNRKHKWGVLNLFLVPNVYMVNWSNRLMLMSIYDEAIRQWGNDL